MTDQFMLTIGTRPGYGDADHTQNQIPPYTEHENLMRVAGWWHTLMTAEAQKSGVLVTAIIHPARAIYAAEHGCPPGGEQIVVIAGNRNPTFAPSSTTWHQAVRAIAEALRVALGQSTAQLTFTVVDFHYLRDTGVTP